MVEQVAVICLLLWWGAIPVALWWLDRLPRRAAMDEADRVRQVAMLRRIGAVGGAVFAGALEPSGDSREVYRCMHWNRSARASGHADVGLEYLERAYAAACRAYDAATPEQRAILDAQPAPVFVAGPWMEPRPSALAAARRLLGRPRRDR